MSTIVPPPSDLFRRFGRFYISRQAIADTPEETMAALSEFLVTRAELRFDIDCVEYTAISRWFDPLPLGVAAPLYDLTIRKDEHGTRVVEAIRQKETP